MKLLRIKAPSRGYGLQPYEQIVNIDAISLIHIVSNKADIYTVGEEQPACCDVPLEPLIKALKDAGCEFVAVEMEHDTNADNRV